MALLITLNRTRALKNTCLQLPSTGWRNSLMAACWHQVYSVFLNMEFITKLNLIVHTCWRFTCMPNWRPAGCKNGQHLLQDTPRCQVLEANYWSDLWLFLNLVVNIRDRALGNIEASMIMYLAESSRRDFNHIITTSKYKICRFKDKRIHLESSKWIQTTSSSIMGVNQRRTDEDFASYMKMEEAMFHWMLQDTGTCTLTWSGCGIVALCTEKWFLHSADDLSATGLLLKEEITRGDVTTDGWRLHPWLVD